MLDCVCGSIFPLRAARQFAQTQFHCGKPPPAALPRMWMRINRSVRRDYPFESNSARVTGALKKNRHRFERRLDPPFLIPPHKSHASHRSFANSGQIIFDEADVAAAFHARDSDIEKVVRVCAKTRAYTKPHCNQCHNKDDDPTQRNLNERQILWLRAQAKQCFKRGPECIHS